MIGGIAFRAPAVKYFVLKAPILKADYINNRVSTASYLLTTYFFLLLWLQEPLHIAKKNFLVLQHEQKSLFLSCL